MDVERLMGLILSLSDDLGFADVYLNPFASYAVVRRVTLSCRCAGEFEGLVCAWRHFRLERLPSRRYSTVTPLYP